MYVAIACTITHLVCAFEDYLSHIVVLWHEFSVDNSTI